MLGFSIISVSIVMVVYQKLIWRKCASIYFQTRADGISPVLCATLSPHTWPCFVTTCIYRYLSTCIAVFYPYETWCMSMFFLFLPVFFYKDPNLATNSAISKVLACRIMWECGFGWRPIWNLIMYMDFVCECESFFFFVFLSFYIFKRQHDPAC